MVIIVRVDSDSTPVEKVMLTYVSPQSPMGKPRDITFIASTCLAYFLREKLKLPPPTIPQTIMGATVLVKKSAGVHGIPTRVGVLRGLNRFITI